MARNNPSQQESINAAKKALGGERMMDMLLNLSKVFTTVVLLLLFAFALMQTAAGGEYWAFIASIICIIIAISIGIYGGVESYESYKELKWSIQQNTFARQKLQEHIAAALENVKELEYKNIYSIDSKRHEIKDTQFYCERILGEPAVNSTNINLHIYRIRADSNQDNKTAEAANGQLEVLETMKEKEDYGDIRN